MSRTRKPSPADPLDARIARICAVWAILPAESREVFLDRLDKIGQAWTGHGWLPEYDPAILTAEGAGPLLSEGCRDGDCWACEGAPCEHLCHSNAKENADA